MTLFKRNYHHVVSDAYFKAYHTVARGNPNYFITYGNGKSAARVQSGLRPNGAHRWYSYVKAPKCAPCFTDCPACLLLRRKQETLSGHPNSELSCWLRLTSQRGVRLLHQSVQSSVL